MPVTEETPAFRNIFMKDIQAVNCGKAAYFQGLPEMMLENIELTDASFIAKEGITIIDAAEMKFTNILIEQQEEHVLDIYNGQKVQFDGFTDKSGGFVSISGGNSKDISFKASSIDKSLVKCSKSLKEDTYQIISGL